MSPQKPTCILLTGANPAYVENAVAFARERFEVLRHFNAAESLDEEAAARSGPSFVFSLLYPKILKGPLLSDTAVNFHPAPPEFPGRGSASLALYAGAPTYGATAHIMTRQADAGAILAVRRFPLKGTEGCAEVFERGEKLCWELFQEILTTVAQSGKLPAPSGDRWARKAMTRREFEQWLILNPADKIDFDKKILAARHPVFPGPFVIVNGHKFALVNEIEKKQ